MSYLDLCCWLLVVVIVVVVVVSPFLPPGLSARICVSVSNFTIIIAGSDDDAHMRSDEIDGEISIGTEIPDQEPIDEIQNHEFGPSYSREQEDPSTSSVNLHVDDSHGKYQFHNHGDTFYVEFSVI